MQIIVFPLTRDADDFKAWLIARANAISLVILEAAIVQYSVRRLLYSFAMSQAASPFTCVGVILTL